MTIYAHVVGKPDLLVHKPDGPLMDLDRSKTRGAKAKASRDLQALWNTRSPLAITFTCRQMYHEAVKVWYGDLRFYFYSLPCMAVFLTEIGIPNRNAIRFVRYDQDLSFLNKQAAEVKQSICTRLIGLRNLTLHCGYRPLEIHLNAEHYWQQRRTHGRYVREMAAKY